MKALRIFLKVMLPLAVLALGALVARALIRSRKPPERVKVTPPVSRVEVVEAPPSTDPVTVVATGTVQPAHELQLAAEVSAKVTGIHANLEPGGRVAAGAVLVRLDRRDYALAVTQQQANVERARFELKLEEGRGTVAEREWKLLPDAQAATETGRALAQRKPHLENARAALRAAKAGLRRARLNLERTEVKAPFAAVVTARQVELGQLVGPQTPLCTLVGSERFWIEVRLPLERLRWFAHPDAQGQGGAEATVIQELGGGERVVRKGKVVRIRQDLDPLGRLAQVLIAVDHPLDPPALFLDAFVRVEIEGRAPEIPVVSIPRRALREADQVWVLGAKGTLEVRQATVHWRDEVQVLLSKGVAPGEAVIVSPLPAPVPGMALQRVDRPPPREAQTPAEGDGAKEPTL